MPASALNDWSTGCDHPVTTTWRCVPIDDVHRTVLGVGDTIPTPRHDPTPRQRDLVTTADTPDLLAMTAATCPPESSPEPSNASASR